MKHFKRGLVVSSILAAACLAAAPNYADNLAPANTVSAYWRVPLDGKPTLETSSFGLRLDRSDAAATPAAAVNAFTQPAMLDLHYRHDGQMGFDVLGIDTMHAGQVLRADGNGVSWVTVGAAIGGGALVMCMAHTLICQQGGGSGTYVPAPSMVMG